MQKALVKRFDFTVAEAGYLVMHCRELAEQILAGNYPEQDLHRVKVWIKKIVRQGAPY